MTLVEGNDICGIVSNLADNGREVEGDKFEFCELKETNFQLVNPCDSSHSFVSAVIKV